MELQNGWIDKIDEKEVINGECEGYIIRENWCIEKDEIEEKREDLDSALKSFKEFLKEAMKEEDFEIKVTREITSLKGRKPDILAGLVCLIKHLHESEKMPEKLLRETVDLAFMSEEEISIKRDKSMERWLKNKNGRID